VRIIVRPNSTGGHEVHSSYRLNEGDPAEPETTTSVSLPVTLRISRSGNRFITSYATDATFVDDLDFTVPGGDLDVQRLRTGMVSASEDDFNEATACFTRVVLHSTPGKPPGLGCLEAFVIPMEGGTELEILGSFLGETTSITLAGVPATILENTSGLLRVSAGALDETGTVRPLSGDVIVTTREGSALLRNAVVYAGEAFLRGNVNGDLATDLSDAIFLLAYLFSGGRAPTCLQSGEINGDLTIDISDAIFLLQHLFLGGAQPEPPFGTEGVSLTGEVCGLPEAPRLTDLTHTDGSPVTPSDTLAEDDVVIFVGENFPIQRDIIVLFDDTRAEVLESSTDSELHVRILTVPTGGRKCPRLMEVWGDARLPEDREGTYINSLGQTNGIIAEVDLPDECPGFRASEVDVVATSRFDETDSALILEFDPMVWTPADKVQVSAVYYLPVSHRGSRGSRYVSFEFSHRELPIPPTFEEWLEQLARRLRLELNGGVARDDECDCDLTAESRPNGVAIVPCHEIGDIQNPGPGPDPGPDLTLQKPKPPLSGGNSILSPPIVCPFPGDINPQTNARLLAWCRFAQLTKVVAGRPKWEGFVPLNAVLNPELAYYLAPPAERSLSQKRIMYNSVAFYHVYNNNWWFPCMPAAYRALCIKPNTDFMPFFPADAIVIKNFWRTFEQLPQGSDGSEFYSFRQEVNGEPTGDRHYLVGMNIMTKDIKESWFWATFWVPRPGGVTVTNEGKSFSYNTLCTVGHNLDIPDDIEGVWQNYIMCVQHAPGETLCGNPWASGECTVTCEGCHSSRGEYDFDDGQQPLQFDWLPSLIRQNEKACFDDVANNIDPLEQFLPDVCDN